MKCGNCKNSHETVAEVRACYGNNGFAPLTTVHDGHNGQYELIQIMLAERDMTPLPPYDEAVKLLSKQQASEMIADLMRTKPVAPAQVKTGGLSKFDVPQGYYAVKSSGKNDLDFFQVDRPTEGKWQGYTFVMRVIGGKPSVPVRGRAAQAALQAITDAGPGNAALLYGQELKQCSKCNRHLTKKASRALAYGPQCAEQRGLGEEWMRLNSQFGGE